MEKVDLAPSTAEALKDSPTTGRRSREKGKSVDDVLARNETYGAGLNQLDTMLQDLPNASPNQKRDAAPKAKAQTTATPEAIKAVKVAAKAKQQGSNSTDAALGVVAVSLGASLVLDYASGWFVILTFLVTTAVSVLGVDHVKTIYAALAARPTKNEPWLAVPLTDTVLDIGSGNKLANSAQVREKGLKILQYILKGSAYSALFSKCAPRSLSQPSAHPPFGGGRAAPGGRPPRGPRASLAVAVQQRRRR